MTSFLSVAGRDSYGSWVSTALLQLSVTRWSPRPFPPWLPRQSCRCSKLYAVPRNPSYSTVFRYTSNAVTLTRREIIKHADQAVREHLETEIPFLCLLVNFREISRFMRVKVAISVDYLVEFDRLMNFFSFLVFSTFPSFYCSNFIQPSIQISSLCLPFNPSENRKNDDNFFKTGNAYFA